LRIAEAVHTVNQEQPVRFCEKIHKHFQGQLSGHHLTVWGLAFKLGTDDMREAPSITIIEKLLEHGAKITVYDPQAQRNARAIFGERISYADDLYHSLRGAEALLLVTERDDFRHANFARIRQEMKSPVIFDGRNAYDKDELRRLGFIYYGVGRR
jgi:UDPglucose 6-dehydrogenase